MNGGQLTESEEAFNKKYDAVIENFRRLKWQMAAYVCEDSSSIEKVNEVFKHVNAYILALEDIQEKEGSIEDKMKALSDLKGIGKALKIIDGLAPEEQQSLLGMFKDYFLHVLNYFGGYIESPIKAELERQYSRIELRESRDIAKITAYQGTEHASERNFEKSKAALDNASINRMIRRDKDPYKVANDCLKVILGKDEEERREYIGLDESESVDLSRGMEPAIKEKILKAFEGMKLDESEKNLDLAASLEILKDPALDDLLHTYREDPSLTLSAAGFVSEGIDAYELVQNHLDSLEGGEFISMYPETSQEDLAFLQAINKEGCDANVLRAIDILSDPITRKVYDAHRDDLSDLQKEMGSIPRPSGMGP